MDFFTFSLPLPPSLNQAFPTAWKTGRRFCSSEYTAWKNNAGFLLLRTLKDQAFSCQKGNVPWSISINVFFDPAIANRSDLDNRLKPSIDLICSVSGLKDRYLQKITAEKCLADNIAPYIEGRVDLQIAA